MVVLVLAIVSRPRQFDYADHGAKWRDYRAFRLAWGAQATAGCRLRG